MPYIMLTYSVVAQVFAAAMLQYSQGLSIMLPTIAWVISFIVGCASFVAAAKRMNVAVAYGLWGTGCAVLMTIAGWGLLGSVFALFTGLGLALAVGALVSIAVGFSVKAGIENACECVASPAVTDEM